MDHLIDHTAQTPPVWLESVATVTYDFGGHVADSANPAPHRLAIGDVHGQPQITDSHMAWSEQFIT